MNCDRCGNPYDKVRCQVQAAVICFPCWDEIREMEKRIRGLEDRISFRDGVIREQEGKIAGLEARIGRSFK